MVKNLATENWEYYRDLYRSCVNNRHYLDLINDNFESIELLNRQFIDSQIKNTDLIIGNNFHNMVELFKNNQLKTIRLGCIENKFIVNSVFHRNIPGDFKNFTDHRDDSLMCSHAGMYYSAASDKELVNNWWCQNTIELLLNPSITIVSCYMVLAYDLFCLACLDIKNKVIDTYTVQTELIHYFNDRQILVISNGIEDMQKSYNLGMQRLYQKSIPSFSMEFLKSPQTTIHMPYPHDNMIETTDYLINEIVTKYNHCDTIMFCCGAYAAPLINILSRIYQNKNLLYMGSEVYTFFGLYSKGIHKPFHRGTYLFNLNNFMPIQKTCPDQCKHIDGGKYWQV